MPDQEDQEDQEDQKNQKPCDPGSSMPSVPQKRTIEEYARTRAHTLRTRTIARSHAHTAHLSKRSPN